MGADAGYIGDSGHGNPAQVETEGQLDEQPIGPRSTRVWSADVQALVEGDEGQ